MRYDFETTISRLNLSSAKWRVMRDLKPDVSPDVVPFSTADMEFVNAPEIVAGLKSYLDETVLGYPDPADPEYLDSVCGWMKRRHGWDVRPEWIVGAPGVVDAFFWAVRAFSMEGEGVIVQSPVYYPFYDAIGRNGRKVVRNPLVVRGGRYEIDFEDLERKAADPDNSILLFCSPHNPSGRVWSREELARVGEICLRHGVFIISDEIHADIVMPGNRHTAFATLSPELASNMIVCTSASKTFNLAGLKTAATIVPDPRVRARYQEEVKRAGFYCATSLGYKASQIAYDRCSPWLDEAIGVIWGNHLALKAFIAERLPGIKAYPLEGTYLQWMDFSGLGLEADALASLLHDEAELFFDEGRKFGPEGEGFQRMNLACPKRVMMAGLERLEKAVREIGSRQGTLA